MDGIDLSRKFIERIEEIRLERNFDRFFKAKRSLQRNSYFWEIYHKIRLENEKLIIEGHKPIKINLIIDNIIINYLREGSYDLYLILEYFVEDNKTIKLLYSKFLVLTNLIDFELSEERPVDDLLANPYPS